MKDFTSNNCCDFLWIKDLLLLKKNSKNLFSAVIKLKNSTTSINVLNVSVFGTIVEVQQIGSRGFVYHVDDGTGVIACKHNEEQFEEIISTIESESSNVTSQSCLLSNENSENSTIVEPSLDDSVFNDNSVQNEEVDVNKRCQLMGLQSIWNDLYKSFSSLIQPYNIGDVVIVNGKLYNYFNTNQIYVNNIRLMDLTEEITKISIKLEDDCELLSEIEKRKNEKRLSGLMTFDHIQELRLKSAPPTNVKIPEKDDDVLKEDVKKILSPNLESAITFDTFINECNSCGNFLK